MQDLVKEQEFLDNRGASTRAVLDYNHIPRRKKLHKNISDQKGSIYIHERNEGKPGLRFKSVVCNASTTGTWAGCVLMV